MENRILPIYSTMTFNDIWPDVDDFKEDYAECPLGGISSSNPDNVTILYLLLVARYGNNPIANRDINQWKVKIFATIYQYGPTWEKRLDIQETLRNLSEDDLLKGARQIYNHAYNPSTAPGTDDEQTLGYINDQNVSHHTRPKMDAYAELWDLLKVDVTEEFLVKFRKCFKTFVSPEQPMFFVSEDEDEEEA